MIDLEKIIQEVLTRQFPGYKNGDFFWNDKRFFKDNILNWYDYYNVVLYLENLIFNVYKLGLCSEIDYYRYKYTVNKHRIKFITRLYKLKILDYYFYRIIRYSEGLNGCTLYNYICYYEWINIFEIHPLSKSQIRIPNVILKTKCDITKKNE